MLLIDGELCKKRVTKLPTAPPDYRFFPLVQFSDSIADVTFKDSLNPSTMRWLFSVWPIAKLQAEGFTNLPSLGLNHPSYAKLNQPLRSVTQIRKFDRIR